MDEVRQYSLSSYLLLAVAIALSYVALFLPGIDAALSNFDNVINGGTRQDASLHPVAILFGLSPTLLLVYAILKLGNAAKIMALAILITLIAATLI